MNGIIVGSKVAHINGGSTMEVTEVDKETQVVKVKRVTAKGITEEAYFKYTDLVIVY